MQEDEHYLKIVNSISNILKIDYSYNLDFSNESIDFIASLLKLKNTDTTINNEKQCKKLLLTLLQSKFIYKFLIISEKVYSISDRYKSNEFKRLFALDLFSSSLVTQNYFFIIETLIILIFCT